MPETYSGEEGRGGIKRGKRGKSGENRRNMNEECVNTDMLNNC